MIFAYSKNNISIKRNKMIKLFINQTAKTIVKNIIKDKKQPELDLDNMHINRWLAESHIVKCYIFYEKDIVKGLILLSKCDYDPYKKHMKPFLLDYIYVFPEYRRNNVAFNLLLYIKDREQITAFCNDESENLFKKANYTFVGNDELSNSLSIFRFP